ncbi:sperm-egg fusion protein LLCFC1 [Monodelphis domestica]|uniref:sperm-egg fusion protein LLCFC1 n=1 Tax=Monodelphis domestica TaxID=13616 RepID=UPI00005E8640|nr:sperm-egg fusion protein LLCFC1 [Monodelphis domestica]
MTSQGPKLHQASLLVCLLLLLLLVQGVKPQNGDHNGKGRSQKGEEASPKGEGEEQLEEQFVVSSVGEILQLLNMQRSEEEEETEGEVEMEENAAVRDHLFDLAFCFNLASILVFL